jgi:hypothetical protein
MLPPRLHKLVSLLPNSLHTIAPPRLRLATSRKSAEQARSQANTKENRSHFASIDSPDSIRTNESATRIESPDF